MIQSGNLQAEQAWTQQAGSTSTVARNIDRQQLATFSFQAVDPSALLHGR